MQWLLQTSERYRLQICQGPFFQKLSSVERPNDLQWVHQLIHQSREFTQALCLRYSLCHDRRYQPVFAEHALEEADHPDQLIAWMKEHEFLKDEEPGGIPATQETLNCTAFSWRSAMHEPHDVQVIGLNLLSEGVAFDFYSAVIPVLDRLDILSGRYWKVHTDVDQHHLTMGIDLCEPVAADSAKGRLYQRVLWHSASLYHQMLSSWVGEHVEPLPQLR
jgi:heme oxygenase-like protein